ncbi:MAG: prepilin-type N-terminal cleavage/methylation domain-containing protein [Chthoniobacteraceae bacterium]|nr:prepilin-type N-terminal cleavage/methylation domain-containing protein [Chthoniobacteraceae bacterium]
MKRVLLKLRGFTLVELLVVISIITILAGLTLSTVSYAQNKAARDLAKAEIAGLEVGLESYKADNGDYPRSSNPPGYDDNAAEALDAANNPGDPGSTGSPNATYAKATRALYIGLSGDTNLDGNVTVAGDSTDGTTKPKVYFNFKPNMLYPRMPSGSTRAANSIQAVIDPFYFPYGYSTLGSKVVTTGSQAGGYNPTFDLWSTGGNHPGDQKTWITNW